MFMDKITQAINVLNEGGIVIFPTDTAFGIGCRMDREKSVKKLFSLRRRPLFQATPVLVDSIDMAKNYLVSPLSNIVRQMMENYWPGGLTIVERSQKDKVTPLVRGNGENLGVRMPDHKTPLTLIGGIGVPLLGPSANFHGKPTPYLLKEIDPELIKLTDMLLEGECGNNTVSTVVDCTVHPFRVVRSGAVKL